ncbi:MAG: iron-containing alcohol dehydrogenase [Bryobacteraceae bacterium]
MRFEFATAARIVCGPGSSAELPAIAASFGKRALIVTGRDPKRTAHLAAMLEECGISTSHFAVDSEPTVDCVRTGAQQARGACDLVIGIGGGSAIDAAKAIAAMITNSGEPLDYLEVIGRGQPLEHAPVPFVAVPTTAGAGAEVTRNAVLGSPAHGVKASLRGAALLAKAAIIDSNLTLNLPPFTTATTGLDALTQVIEPFVSSRANPLVDLFCRDGMRRIAASLPRAFHCGTDSAARESMAFASLLGGLALANAGLGVVHGFAAPLGGMLHAPHGALCAAVLPYGMAQNIAALRARAPGHPSLSKYREAACLMTGDSNAQPEDGVDWVRSLCNQLQIPSLKNLGLEASRIPELVGKAAQASSMKANPLLLNAAELTAVIQHAL